MKKIAAGILVYKKILGEIYVLLVHPGGPYWTTKDIWSIPKGEAQLGEDLFLTAKREFREELGIDPPDVAESNRFEAFNQNKHKILHIWYCLASNDWRSLINVNSNRFECEWPPNSKKMLSFPEVDKAEWMPLKISYSRIIKGQRQALDLLVKISK